MTEFQILSATKNNGGNIGYTDLLNLNMTDPVRDPLADKARIKQMISDGLLNGATDAYCLISITDAGRRYLQDACYLDEQKKQLAKEASKKETNKNRHEWKLAIVGAIISGLAGLAFEVFAFFFLS